MLAAVRQGGKLLHPTSTYFYACSPSESSHTTTCGHAQVCCNCALAVGPDPTIGVLTNYGCGNTVFTNIDTYDGAAFELALPNLAPGSTVRCKGWPVAVFI
jgi:hypothetical protein